MDIPVAAHAAPTGGGRGGVDYPNHGSIDYQQINSAIQPRAWRTFVWRKEKRRNQWLRRFRVKPLAMTYSCMA